MFTANSKQKLYRSTVSGLGAMGITALCTLAFVATPAPARAATVLSDTPTIKVRYSDLNLSTDAGTTELYQRIARAAQAVCPSQYSLEFPAVAASRKCQADAIAQAVRDVNNPHLAMVYAAHNPQG